MSLLDILRALPALHVLDGNAPEPRACRSFEFILVSDLVSRDDRLMQNLLRQCFNLCGFSGQAKLFDIDLNGANEALPIIFDGFVKLPSLLL
jgi:hypothetical protein